MVKSLIGGGVKEPAAFWETLDNGSQLTTSPQLIYNALGRLQRKRQLITVTHKGYQSQRTVLLHYDNTLLQIDKPQDWPGSHTVVYILFKDETQVWNQMKAKVKEVSWDVLCLEFPERLVRFQRRSNYRVEVPRGSVAMFVFRDEKYMAQEIRDLSADGMMASTKVRSGFFVSGDDLSDIHLSFPGENGGSSSGTSIKIKRGRIVRITRDENYNFCYGVHFELNHNEEVSLLQYVRQRERELLRRGLAEE